MRKMHKNALRNCQTPPLEWNQLESLLPGWDLEPVHQSKDTGYHTPHLIEVGLMEEKVY